MERLHIAAKYTHSDLIGKGKCPGAWLRSKVTFLTHKGQERDSSFKGKSYLFPLEFQSRWS